MSLADPSRTRPSRHSTRALLALAALLLLVAAARLFVGTSTLGLPTGEAASAILHQRLLRLAAAAMVGVALASSGVALQALLRNPLAEPFILGLSSGAAVGVMAQWLLAYWFARTVGVSHLGAVLGAAVSAAIVYFAGRKRGVIDPLGLLLVGVVLSTINGAIIMLLNYLVGPAGLRDDLARWMMGYINEGNTPATLGLTALVTLAGVLTLVWQARAMDVGSFSDTEAASLGVNLPLLRTLLFLVASVLAAAAVVLAGPVAFVGLIAPHVARLLLGPAHRTLVIGAAILGAVLIIAADAASSFLALKLRVGLMPIGIFTAMIGGPVFLWMLRPQLGRGDA